MPKKITQPPRPPQSSSNTALSKRADPVAGELLQHLADTPALAAAGVLATMLLDAEDSTTRLAIMRTRIRVLRARTTACQLGQPVAGNITLGEVFANQASAEQQLSAHLAEPPDSGPEPEDDTAAVAEPVDAVMKVRLLQTYTHAGIELPEGGVFVVSAHSAKDLAERGICDVVENPETPDKDKDKPEDPKNVK